MTAYACQARVVISSHKRAGVCGLDWIQQYEPSKSVCLISRSRRGGMHCQACLDGQSRARWCVTMKAQAQQRCSRGRQLQRL